MSSYGDPFGRAGAARNHRALTVGALHFARPRGAKAAGRELGRRALHAAIVLHVERRRASPRGRSTPKLEVVRERERALEREPVEIGDEHLRQRTEHRLARSERHAALRAQIAVPTRRARPTATWRVARRRSRARRRPRRGANRRVALRPPLETRRRRPEALVGESSGPQRATDSRACRIPSRASEPLAGNRSTRRCASSVASRTRRSPRSPSRTPSAPEAHRPALDLELRLALGERQTQPHRQRRAPARAVVPTEARPARPRARPCRR